MSDHTHTFLSGNHNESRTTRIMDFFTAVEDELPDLNVPVALFWPGQSSTAHHFDFGPFFRQSEVDGWGWYTSGILGNVRLDSSIRPTHWQEHLDGVKYGSALEFNNGLSANATQVFSIA